MPIVTRSMSRLMSGTVSSPAKRQKQSRKPKTGVVSRSSVGTGEQARGTSLSVKRRSNDRREAQKEMITKSQKAKRRGITDARRSLPRKIIKTQAVPGKKSSLQKFKGYTPAKKEPNIPQSTSKTSIRNGVVLESTDSEEVVDTKRQPGCIFMMRKKNSNGTPTDSYSLTVGVTQHKTPSKVTKRGFSVVSWRQVVCIKKAEEVIYKALCHYADPAEEKGWYKVAIEDFNEFMAVFNKFVQNYAANI